jgi:trk system potassium uptake protein TrkA
MKVIIVGTGEVGKHIARTLSLERHDVTLVDNDPERVRALEGELDVLLVAGNGASPKFLSDIGAKGADLLLAVTETDAVNVIAAVAAHQLGVKRTVVRVRDPDYFGDDRDFNRDVLGIDFVIDPEHATADDIVDTMLLPGAVHVEHFADGHLALAETVLTQSSPLVGVVVDERSLCRPNAIVGVVRRGATRIPAGGERLELGDHVLVVSATQDIEPVVDEIVGHADRIRDVVVFGGGKIGIHLVRRLDSSEITVRVMERDERRARYLAERLSHGLVLHEEDLSKDALLSHGVDRAGAFVACAGDDRTNLLAALHAKQLGAGLCLAVVSREEFVPLVDALGIDGAFSLRLTTAEAILRFVRGESVRAMHILLGGSEALELAAEPGSPIDGSSIAAEGLLEACEVGGIVREGKVLIPRQGDGETIRAGDRVLLFRLEGAAKEVARAFDR